MSWRDSIREQALSLYEGETMNGECPFCGRTGSFYITRKDGELLFIDHSVSCGRSGAVWSSGAPKGPAPKKKRKRMTDMPLRQLHPHELRWMRSKFRIPAPALARVRMCDTDSRMYFPQHNTDGVIAGYIARAYPELTGVKQLGPKAIWREQLDRPLDLYFLSPATYNQALLDKQVILVEDYVSALRLWSQLNIPTCALGGTSLYPEHVQRLLSMGLERVHIILDNDAITKAVKLKRQLSLGVEVNLVLLSGADPKDMRLQELLHEISPQLERK